VTGTEIEVQHLVTIELTPNEFAALVSFEFNTGALSTSPGLALINAHSFQEAWDDHFCLYIHDANGVTLAGLVRRRAAERALFFSVT
jgi:GH24 family phage-related lysozyme (muramidase)